MEISEAGKESAVAVAPLPQINGEYRVEPVEGGYEPQQRYRCWGGDLWVPLKEDGFWADPAAYSSGEVTIHPEPMTEAIARRAVWRAMGENRPQ